MSLRAICTIQIVTFAAMSLCGCGTQFRTPASVGQSASPSTLTPGDIASIVIHTSSKGPGIASTFLGLSHEWGDAQSIMGDSQTGTNTIYRTLLDNLTSYGSGPMMIRIGGNSTDTTGDPTATTVLPFAELASATGAHFYLGVNLGSDDPQLATRQATEYLADMPRGSVDAIEIGNEPDQYSQKGMRPPSYSFNDYLGNFDTWKTDIAPLLPTGRGFMGASWAIPGSLSNAGAFVSSTSPALTVFSQHFYVANGQDLNNPPDLLLQPNAATAGPNAVSSAIRTVHSVGLPFRMGEINSLFNGGEAGISDTFQAALWAIDTMFEYVNVGIDGVNWHTGNGGPYDAFSFSTGSGDPTQYSLISVRPLYYGLLFFQEATGNDANLIPATVTTTGVNLKAWATSDQNATVRLVVINKDEQASGLVSVYVPGFDHATVSRLEAPSFTSKSGITIGGQTFDGSIDGSIQGTQNTEQIEGTSGSFQVEMPVTSAALVTFSR